MSGCVICDAIFISSFGEQVETLDLEDNEISDDGCRYLKRMLGENVFISKLNLATNNIGSRGARAIGRMMTVSVLYDKITHNKITRILTEQLNIH